MTEYGRGHGPGQWSPQEDPLYGDPGWDPYAPQDTGYQQAYHPDGAAYGDPYPDPYAHHPSPSPHYTQQQYPEQQYPEQQYADPYATGQLPSYDAAGWDGTGYGGQDPYAGGGTPSDPYGGQHYADPYGATGEQPAVPGGYADPYQAAQAGFPPHGSEPQQPQPAEPQQPAPRGGHPQEGPDPETGWDPGPDQGETDFFTRTDDEWDEEEDEDRGRRSSRRGGRDKRGGGKRRSGTACLVVVALLGGGVGTVGYFGYEFYQSHFAAAPDYEGEGTGHVEVQVPEGTTLAQMAAILYKAGVVKSSGAFVEAANANQKALGINAGIYTLHKKMSAASAITMMLDPKSQNTMIFSEGMRAAEVYAAIDQRFKLKAGTTKQIAHDKWRTFGLPSWANSNPHIKDPLEGFLFPSRYSISKGEKPEVLLKQMVSKAKQQYAKFDLAGEAKHQGLKNPLQLITVASLVQAEGKTDDDFRKMAKVVYNRLVPTNKETYGQLYFDSTYNYIKNQHGTKLSLSEMHALDDPYNTYHDKGLPPGPIGNPGLDALKAAMNPDPGDWYYFISLDGKKTQFTKTYAEFKKLKKNYHPQ
jgi:peptidoglycan lytic transglycosylase G